MIELYDFSHIKLRVKKDDDNMNHVRLQKLTIDDFVDPITVNSYGQLWKILLEINLKNNLLKRIICSNIRLM